MNDRQLEQELKALAGKVRLPQEVRESIEVEILKERDKEPVSTGRLITRRHLLWGGAASAGIAAALLGLAILGRPRQGNPGSATAGSDNPFVLRAYAEGVPQGDGSVLTTKFIGTLGSASAMDDGRWYASRDIDLTCEGDGIASIEYSLSGPHVSQAAGQNEEDQTAVGFDALYNGEVGENEAIPDGNGTASSYTVTYDGQADDERAFNRTLYVMFPADDELSEAAELSRQLYDATGFTRPPSWEEAVGQAESNVALSKLLERRSAEILASATLTMTAHLDEGGMQIHAYSIAPREDFDEVLGQWLDSQVEPMAAISCYRDDPDHAGVYASALDDIQGIYSQPPGLFVLTEQG